MPWSRKHSSKHKHLRVQEVWLLDASQMTFPLTIRNAAACINVARLKRKWFPNVRSRWLLHVVRTPAGNAPPTDHLKLTAAFTQSLQANRSSSGGRGRGGDQRWVTPPTEGKFLFPLFHFHSTYLNTGAATPGRGFAVCWATFSQGFSL